MCGNGNSRNAAFAIWYITCSLASENILTDTLERAVCARCLLDLFAVVVEAQGLKVRDDPLMLVELRVDLDQQGSHGGVFQRPAGALDHLVLEAVDVDLDVGRYRHHAGL